MKTALLSLLVSRLRLSLQNKCDIKVVDLWQVYQITYVVLWSAIFLQDEVLNKKRIVAAGCVFTPIVGSYTIFERSNGSGGKKRSFLRRSTVITQQKFTLKKSFFILFSKIA